MNLDLTKLVNSSLNIEEKINIPTTYLLNTQIQELKNINFIGKANYGEEDEIILEGTINGIMVLIDSYSLDLIDYNFETEVEEVIDLNELKENKIIKKSENILDITDVLWHNIVLEVPISYSETKNIFKVSGDGWELKDKKTNEVDPRLAKLAELLEEGKE